MAIYHGAYIDGDTAVSYFGAGVGVAEPGNPGHYQDVPRDTGAVTQAKFETDAGKGLALSLFSIGDQSSHPFWDSNTTTTTIKALFEECYSRGMYPILDASTYNIPLGDIASGAYDTQITAWFTAMASFGKPWVLRMNVEGNSNNTYPYTFGKAWQSPTRAGHEADFKNSWIKMWNLANATGANANCTWHWAPNFVAPWDVGSPTYDYLTEYYPGDAYVDWMGIVCYNQTVGVSDGDWSYLTSVTYPRLTALSSKPIMVSEWSSWEFTSPPTAGHGTDATKGAWLQHTLDYVRTSQTQIKAMVLFNVDAVTENPDALESIWTSVPAATGPTAAGYKAGIADATYVGRQTTMNTSGKLPLPSASSGGGSGSVYDSALYDVSTYGGGSSDVTIVGVRALAPGRAKPGKIIGGTLSDYSGRVFPDTPISYWRLGEASPATVAVDEQGVNNGTYTGPVTLAATGLTGDSNKAITVSGSGYVSIGNPASLQLSTLTVEAWFKTPSGTTEAIVGKADCCVLYVKAGRLFTYDYGSTNPGFVETDTGVTVNNNIAHHVAMTFQSGVVNGTKIYLDGVLVWTGTQTVFSQASEWEIGANAGTPFAGTLDEVAIYGSVLSPARIAVHAAGAPTGPDVTIVGKRIVAPVSPHPGSLNIQMGSVQVIIPGVTAHAYAYATGVYGSGIYGAGLYGGGANNAGTVLIIPARQRGTPAAAGKPGTVVISNNNVLIIGVRAAIAAAGRPGTVLLRPARQRAAAAAVGKPGTVVIGRNVLITGVRALAHVLAHAGSILISNGVSSIVITGVRALATRRGKAGSVSITYTILFTAIVPTVAVLIDVDNDPTNPTRAWTDITHYVRQVELSRDGRSNETENTQPGALSMLLDNRDGRFNRQNPAGPYYPKLKTTRWLKVQASWSGVTYDRWTGLVDLVSQQWPEYGKDATAEIQGSSALKVLNLSPLGVSGTTYPETQSGARVTTVVTDAGLTVGAIDTGSATLPLFAPAAGDNVKALPHLQDVESEEHGIVFTNPSGEVEFHDRHHRFDAVTVATISDIPGAGIPYLDPQLSDDDQFLFNSAHRVTSSGNATGWLEDGTSATEHFVRDNTETLLSDDGNEAQAAAEAFVLRYKEPSLRVSQVSIIGGNSPSNWPTILSAGNSDRFMFVRHYPNAGTVTETVFLEQVRESITPGQHWDTTWLLSPGTVDAYMSSRFWRVGNSTYGHLGTFAIGW